MSNSFRKVLVYFGLAEDREYYDDEPDYQEPERELETRYQERPNVRRLQSRRRRDEIDDIFVGEVVLVVMILERLGRHVGRERVIGVRQVRKLESHGRLSLA